VRQLVESLTGDVRAVGVAEAVAGGEVVLFAVPWSAVGSIAQANADSLADKIVLDATNHFGGPDINNVSTIRASAPRARVFRAFNSLGWEIFAQPRIAGEQVDLFYCGPDEEGRAALEVLIADVGLRPVWVGDLDHVSLVDNLGALWVHLVVRRGMPRNIALRLLTE
jgi:predicted dinucleotide-binding enzyme